MPGRQLLDLGRDVATRLATSEGVDAAFLAGSIVVGLGSPSSDVDVYLVGSGLRESRRQLLDGGVRVDVQTLAAERLADLVDRVVADYPAALHDRVADADLMVAVRLLAGEIVTDTGFLLALKQRLAASPLPLRRMVINSWARTAYSAVEDVAGLRESSDRLDRDAAIIAARRALLAAGKALAASCGDLHHGDKWVSHQLATAPRTPSRSTSTGASCDRTRRRRARPTASSRWPPSYRPASSRRRPSGGGGCRSSTGRPGRTRADRCDGPHSSCRAPPTP
jgi:hypothetical protein